MTVIPILILTALFPNVAASSSELVVVGQAHVTLPTEVYLGVEFDHEFVFRNEGDRPIRIVEAVDINGSAELDLSTDVVPPRSEAVLTVRQPADRLGRFAYRYAVVTDEAEHPRVRVSLSGFAESAYDPEMPDLDFGWVDETAGSTLRVEIGSREVDRLEIVEVESPSDHLRLAAVERAGMFDEKATLVVELLPGAPRGVLLGELPVATNVPHQPRLGLSYRARVFGDVLPSETPVDLGLTHAGRTLEKAVVLRSRTDTPFAVTGSTQEPADGVELSFEPCRGVSTAESSPCWILTLSARSDIDTTRSGMVAIRVGRDDRPIPLPYVARWVPETTRIKKLEVPEADP